MCLEFFHGHELQRAGVGRFQIDGRGAIVIERSFPTRDADTPFISRFQSGEAPFGPRCDQIVAVEHREIEELLRHLDTDCVLADVVRPGATIPVAVEPGERIATAAFEFGSQNVGWHGGTCVEAWQRSSALLAKAFGAEAMAKVWDEFRSDNDHVAFAA
jgi:hypothetical protein